MKYLITRASDWRAKPCKGCINEGKRENNPRWTIEIDDINKFIDDIGEDIIISRSDKDKWSLTCLKDGHEDLKEITIYDDYVE